MLQELNTFCSGEVRVFNNLGILMKRNGKTQEAESVYNAALDIDPESFFPNYNMGVLKVHMKDYSAAFEYFSRSLEISRIQNE